MSSDQFILTRSEAIALEYNTLRGEIQKRIELRHQIVSATLAIAGAFIGVGVTNGILALIYPPIAIFLAIGWAQNDVRIYHMAHDGNYVLCSTKPRIAVQPSTSTVHSLNEIFKVNITVLDVVGLYEFNFTLRYNTTLLDTIDVQVGPFLQSPRYVHKRMIDDANGFIWVWVWSAGSSSCG